MEFVDQLKSSIDIVTVIGEYVRLRKASAQRYSGLCPFHAEKTPSFSVHAARQFYHCFGCHASGDVLKFVMEIEGVSFYEALKSLAERYGIPMPRRSQYSDDESRLRGSLYQMHELAQDSFRKALNGQAGEAARAYLAKRGLAPETIERFGLGYSDRSGRALLRLFDGRFPPDAVEQSGLAGKREDGSMYDRFRNRLMFPIHNESGKIIGFGGRALTPGEEPKYLNSPETSIYKKSHVLYNLHRAKEAIRKQDRTILVEGYMDAIGVATAGFEAVVASCGTALTVEQARMIKRHSERLVVNFDPDAPGAAAAERSINLLLDAGLHVRIMELDGELDPDEYCKQRGPAAYGARLEAAKGYFYWLADRARARNDLHSTEGVAGLLRSLVPAVSRITDRLERMAVANDLAAYVGVDARVVLDSIRPSPADRRETAIAVPKELLRPDEKGLLHVLLSDVEGREQLAQGVVEAGLFERLPARHIWEAVAAAHAAGTPLTFGAIEARLEEADRNLLAAAMFSEESDGHDTTLEFGRQCLDNLLRSGEKAQRALLKERVKQAERAGDFAEALRLTSELGDADRAGGPTRR